MLNKTCFSWRIAPLVFCDHRNFHFFFFNDTATTEIYTLSLHDALPISSAIPDAGASCSLKYIRPGWQSSRSEEHTSELQSQSNLVCRLLLEKKKKAKLLRLEVKNVMLVSWVSIIHG